MADGIGGERVVYLEFGFFYQLEFGFFLEEEEESNEDGMPRIFFIYLISHKFAKIYDPA